MKKAQLQIMENVFVLIIIFIILFIAFIFVIGFQKAEQKDLANEFKQLELMKKAQVLNFLPEMQCSDDNNLDPNCYDILKINAFKNELQRSDFYYRPLLGNIKIVIKKYDPSPDINQWGDEWLLYDNPKPDFKGIKEIRYPVSLKDSLENSNYFGVIFLGVYE